MKCPKCNHQNKEGLNYCVQCGNFIGNTCPNCKKEVNVGNVYCGFCGSKLNPHLSDQKPKEGGTEERETEYLTGKYVKFLEGTHKTLKYWGWALLGILAVIGALLGVGEWGVLTEKAKKQAEEAVDKCIEDTIDAIEARLIEKASRLESDKGYVNLRIARLLNSIHRELVTGEEYKKADYMEDIYYWIEKAKKQFRGALDKYPENVQAYFELGRAYYNYPFTYGIEDHIHYSEAIKYFEEALYHYDDKQKEAGLDEETYYYLGNVYYDLWKKKENDEDKKKALENFGRALEERPGKKLDVKLRPCAEKMLAELKGGEECKFTPAQRFFPKK